MATRSGPQGLYQIDSRQEDPFVAVFRAAGMIVLGFVAVLWIGTEVAASRLGYQRALGTPLAAHLYEPWAIFRWMFVTRGSHDPRLAAVFGQFWQIVEIGAAIVLVLAVALVVRSMRRAAGGANDVHGSAHWASEPEIRKSGLLGGGKGVYVGAAQLNGKTHYLRHDGPEHVLAFAPTRSGKGVGLVLPTLLSWPHSVIVHDIKGENYALTSGWRARDLGSRVLKFDPASPSRENARYNPLDQVRLRTEHEIKDVQTIVQILVDPEGKGADGQEAHWIATSSALLVGVVLHVLYLERDKSLTGVANFLSSPGFENPTQMYETMAGADHDPDGSLAWTDSTGRPTKTHPVVAMAARDMQNKDPKEGTSVLSTATRFLTLFRDPIVARNTSSSDFTIASLMNDERPVSLYVVIPPSDIDRLRPLTRIVFNQLLRTLTAEMEFADGRSVANYKHRLLLMIDELPSMGRLEILQTSLAYMAGYGIKAYLIAQDVAQLGAAYGGPTGRDETIMANCHVQVAFAPNKIETMELLSKMAGTMTIRQENRSYSGSRIGIRNQVMVNQQESQRPLLTPDEARRLPADDSLIFVAGHPPIYGKKIKYFQDRTFAERAKIAATASPRTGDEQRELADVTV